MELAGLRSDGTSDDGDERIGSGTAMGAAETPATKQTIGTRLWESFEAGRLSFRRESSGKIRRSSSSRGGIEEGGLMDDNNEIQNPLVPTKTSSALEIGIKYRNGQFLRCYAAGNRIVGQISEEPQENLLPPLMVRLMVQQRLRQQQGRGRGGKFISWLKGESFPAVLEALDDKSCIAAYAWVGSVPRCCKS